MKSYTDIDQSKKLAEILPIESADTWYWEWPTAPKYNNYEHPMFHKGDDIVNVPCWSLAALLGVLNIPALTQNNDDDWDVVINDSKHPDEYIEVHGPNPVDTCVEMILKLHKEKLI